MVGEYQEGVGVAPPDGRFRGSIGSGRRCFRRAQCSTELVGGNQAELIKLTHILIRFDTARKDGVTGDCLTTLRVTRLPLYQIIHESTTSDQHQLINEICRSTKIFEITKIKDFDQCRSDPLRVSFNPQSDQLPSQRGALQVRVYRVSSLNSP